MTVTPHFLRPPPNATAVLSTDGSAATGKHPIIPFPHTSGKAKPILLELFQSIITSVTRFLHFSLTEFGPFLTYSLFVYLVKRPEAKVKNEGGSSNVRVDLSICMGPLVISIFEKETRSS